MKVLDIKFDSIPLKCGICHSEILNSSKIYNSEILFIPFCYECEKTFDKDDKELLLSILAKYGGYFGMFSYEKYSLIDDLDYILKENIIINDQEDLEKINIRLLHNALLHGISIQEYILKLELMI
ncbi:MAG: hypothetical protein KGD63_13695 [Candidatus Lokiarchaeota archaeon]|nr:hypothetical protein [Candidatus Lokiarchaeota archaeon]